MVAIVEPKLGLVGPASQPFAGRVMLRTFNGSSEALYISAKAPSETETLNAWFADAGDDYRIVPRKLPKTSAPEEDAEPKESNSDRVARRAKQKIRWGAKAIGADRMLTLTYRENQTDLALAKAHLTKFVTLCRKKWPTFKYVAVPEQQERGAWHWHVAIQGFVAADTLRGYWWRAMGHKVAWSEGGKPVLRDLTETPGNIDIMAPRSRGQKRRTWNVNTLCAYMAKYMTKAVQAGLDHKASYSLSRGLTWRVERFVIRALTYSDVVRGFFSVLEGAGLKSDHLFQAEDRRILWAACSPLSTVKPAP